MNSKRIHLTLTTLSFNYFSTTNEPEKMFSTFSMNEINNHKLCEYFGILNMCTSTTVIILFHETSW